MDHKSYRVACNPTANFIIPTPFYVEDMRRLDEDNSYLKLSLWPLMEGFFAYASIG
jgi:hypothetical protein